MSNLTETLADGGLASEGFTFTLSTSVSDSAAGNEQWSYTTVPGLGIADSAEGSEQWTPTLTRQFSIADKPAKPNEQWQIALVKSVVETANATETWTAILTPSIRDSAQASDVLTPSMHYNLSIVDNARASEASFIPTTVLVVPPDSASASELWTPDYTFNTSIVDTASATDAISAVRRVNISMLETFEGVDVLTPQMAYSVALVENAWAGDDITPSGSLTAFAINTRTNAVTEYRNFVFNSAVSINRKYVIANDEGLFELNGPTDEGNVNVIAKIQGGYFNANGNKYSGLKGVYLKVKGQGSDSTPNWMLHLHTGDGSDYLYLAPSNPGLMTSKFRIGKGIKATEIGWGVINADGQDFDWDNIEFIPAMSGRRVG